MDPLIAAGASKIVEVLAEKALKRSLNLGWRKATWLPVTLVRRHECVRVACSTFLRVSDDQQRYLLIRNLHRPEFFGPVGGCYKYFDGEGAHTLEQFFYDADTTVEMEEALRDIRGYIRRSTTAKFFEWFQTGRGRESARECLSREVREELFGECALVVPPDFRPESLSFRFRRSFLEKSIVSGTRTLQFRLFEVHDLDLESRASRALLTAIHEARSDRLLWATKQEIELGRHTSDRAALGHAAVLLINDSLSRPDLPSHAKR